MKTTVSFGVSDPQAAEGLASWYMPGLVDGFGDRLLMFDNTDNDALELLRFRTALVETPGFEEIIREQVRQLGRLPHAAFPIVRAVQRLETDGSLVLVSKYHPGRRLSEFLAERRPGKGLHPAFVTWVASQIMQPLSILQSAGEGLAHGALTADRIILTSDGRVRVLEHVLGAAVRHFDQSPAQLWNNFGLLVPIDGKGSHRLDTRADVFQVGALALSMLLARRVTPTDLEQRLPALLDQWSNAATARSRLFCDPLRLWLERMLQVGDRPYRTAAEAYADLRALPSASASRAFECLQAPEANGAAPSPAIRQSTQSTIQASEEHMADSFSSDNVQPGNSTPPAGTPTVGPAGGTPAAGPPGGTPAVGPAGGIADYGFPMEFKAAPASRPPDVMSGDSRAEPNARPPLVPETEFRGDPGVRFPGRQAVEYSGASHPWSLGHVGNAEAASREYVTRVRRATPGRVSSSRKTRSLIAAGLAAVALVEAIVIAAMFMRESPEPTVITTAEPSQTAIQVTAQEPSIPPVTTLLVETGAASDQGGTLPNAVTDIDGRNAEALAAAAIARAASNQRSGGVRLSAPIELKVLEGDRVLGSTADGPIVATAGTYQLDLINTAFGFRARRAITFRAGEITTIAVAIPPGRISLNAEPWAEVWIDNRQVGETPLANLEIPIGEHEIIFRHPELGERRQNVVVRADSITRASMTFDR